VIRRLVELLAAIVAALLTGFTSAGATPAAAVAPAHIYDCPDHLVPTICVVTGREPPAVCGLPTAYDAADRWSRGTSARPDETTPGSTTTYTASDEVVQVARATGTTQANVRGHTGAPLSLARGDVAANSADNVVNGTRLGQQLARESADSVFASSGRLSSGAIADSRQIIPGSRLGNKDLVQRLTSDGSNIADWGKYTTRTHQSPSATSRCTST